MASQPEYPTEEQYPTIAASEYFEVWEDPEDDAFVMSFNLNGVTIAVERELFPDFARVVAQAAEYARSGGNGRRG